MANLTSSYDLPPLPAYTLQRKPDILPWLGDQHLAYLLPILAYWGVSMLFHLIDEWDLFPQYRLHTPAEVLKRNHVSRWEVFRDVIIQQIIQSAVGWLLAYFEPEAFLGKEEYDVAVWAQRVRIAERAIPAVLGFAGVNAAALAQNVAKTHPLFSGVLAGGQYPWSRQTLLADGAVGPAFAPWELLVARVIYWAMIPALQFGIAILTVDTWQYFWHRAMHMNKWLYSMDAVLAASSYQLIRLQQPSTLATTVYTSPTPTAPFTTIHSKVSYSIRLEQASATYFLA